jgi:hypothetical protein
MTYKNETDKAEAIRFAQDLISEAKIRLEACYAHTDGINDALTDMINCFNKLGVDRNDPTRTIAVESLEGSRNRSMRLETEWQKRVNVRRDMLSQIKARPIAD